MWCIVATLRTRSKLPSGNGIEVPDPLTARTLDVLSSSTRSIPSDGSSPATS